MVILAVSYLLIVGIGLYYSWGVEAVRPRYQLFAALAVVGMGLGVILAKVFGKKENAAEASGSPCTAMLIFTVLQGGIGFAAAFYLFKLTWLAALSFPAGAVIAFAIWWTLHGPFRPALARIISAGLLAGGLAIGLRLEGVPGSVLYGLGLLNAYILGAALLRDEEAEEWYRILAFGAFLVVGRAAIQYFLLSSGYAALGVVVTHPYTFVALFAGFILPLIYPMLQDEDLLPGILLPIILGVFLPVALGVFVHVRPMAAYLFGLVVSVFATGIFLPNFFRGGLLGYLSLATACLAFPLFKETADLSRVVRLEILAGIFLLSVIILVIRAPKNPPRSEAAP